VASIIVGVIALIIVAILFSTLIFIVIIWIYDKVDKEPPLPEKWVRLFPFRRAAAASMQPL
jgi:uncharacterized protein YneF (UPF0154 family)